MKQISSFLEICYNSQPLYSPSLTKSNLNFLSFFCLILKGSYENVGIYSNIGEMQTFVVNENLFCVGVGIHLNHMNYDLLQESERGNFVF